MTDKVQHTPEPTIQELQDKLWQNGFERGQLEERQYKALCGELLAALVELDRQVHKFCEEEGEWDFYTGDSEKAIQHAKEVLK